MSSQDPKPSVDQLKADLERRRRELVGTVDELSTRLDPRVQAKAATENVVERAKVAGDKISEVAKQVSEKVSTVASDLTASFKSDAEDPWAFAPDPDEEDPDHARFQPGPEAIDVKEAVTIAAVAAAGIGAAVAIIAAIRRRS